MEVRFIFKKNKLFRTKTDENQNQTKTFRKKSTQVVLLYSLYNTRCDLLLNKIEKKVSSVFENFF